MVDYIKDKNVWFFGGRKMTILDCYSGFNSSHARKFCMFLSSADFFQK